VWQCVWHDENSKSNRTGHAEHGWLDTYHLSASLIITTRNGWASRSLRVINDDLVMPGMGFGTHPHRDMEIIHLHPERRVGAQGFDGQRRVIRTGEVQYMAAGTGVQHSEFNPSPMRRCILLQIWIQPDRKGVPPRYAEKSMVNTPTGVLHRVHEQDRARRFHCHSSGCRPLAGQNSMRATASRTHWRPDAMPGFTWRKVKYR